jgi:hypothetical protein
MWKDPCSSKGIPYSNEYNYQLDGFRKTNSHTKHVYVEEIGRVQFTYLRAVQVYGDVT